MLRLHVNTMKSGFFDRGPVIEATTKAARRVLSRFGAFVRTRAITSMIGHQVRRSFGVKSKVSNREGVSEPGQPPFPHLGLIVKFIQFAYEFATKTVVIGPERLNMTGNAPEALEKGLPSVIRRGPKNKSRLEQVQIGKRPYMRPAFAVELAGLPAMFKDQIRKG